MSAERNLTDYWSRFTRYLCIGSTRVLLSDMRLIYEWPDCYHPTEATTVRALLQVIWSVIAMLAEVGIAFNVKHMPACESAYALAMSERFSAYRTRMFVPIIEVHWSRRHRRTWRFWDVR